MKKKDFNLTDVQTEKIAVRLKELRNEEGISHNELSTAVGISRDTLIKYEKSDKYNVSFGTNRGMNIDFLVALAKHYGTSTDYILCNTDIKTPDISIQAMNRKLGLTNEALQALQDFNKKHSNKSVIGAECEFLEELITNQSIFTACELAIKHAKADYFNTIDRKIEEEKMLLESDSENIGLHYVELRKLNAEKERLSELKEFEKWKIMKTIEQGIVEAMDSLNLVYDKIDKESEEK